MATHGSIARLYWHTYDFSAYTEGVEMAVTVDTDAGRPWGGPAIAVAGSAATTFSLTGGPYASGANAEEAWTRLSEDDEARPLVYLPGGDVLGRLGWATLTLPNNMQVTVPQGAVRLPVGTVAAKRADLARVLRALGSGGISPSTGVDNGVATTGGGAAYLYCLALDGDTLDVTVEDSANGADWDTLVEMTTLTGIGSERKVITGTVRRHLRVSWDLDGTSATWGLVFGRR